MNDRNEDNEIYEDEIYEEGPNYAHSQSDFGFQDDLKDETNE